MSEPRLHPSLVADLRTVETRVQVDAEALPAHETLQVPALVHGRVLLRLPAGEAPPEALLVGFHGYAERAEDALAALLRVAGDRPWALAAPQALHPFYRRDGKVGGSWMTAQDRELHMAVNVAYANAAIAQLRQRVQGPGASAPPLAILGFSQGVAMAYRAAAWCAAPVDAVVALAGDVPPELRGARWAQRPAVLLGRGDQEKWYTEEKLAGDVEALTALGMVHEVRRFKGAHEWEEEFVLAAREFLARRLAVVAGGRPAEVTG